MSVGIQFKIEDFGSLARLDAQIRKLSSADLNDLLDSIGSEVEAQTRTRIMHEKSAPDGTAWKEWSPAYAKTRHINHSLLMNTGDLLGSIEHQVEGSEVVVGSNKKYAAAVDSKRQYLGLSAQNEADIESLTIDFMGDLLK